MIDYKKLREDKRAEGFAKLGERLDATMTVITAALVKDGLKVKKGSTSNTEREIEVNGCPRIRLEAHYRGSHYSDGPTGTEALSFKVGHYGEQIIIRSAKEDPNLTGARVPRIVELVKNTIAHGKQVKKDNQTRDGNFTISKKRVARLKSCAKGVSKKFADELQFDPIDHDSRLVRLYADVEVTEEEAEEITRVLVPLLVKIKARTLDEKRGNR